MKTPNIYQCLPHFILSSLQGPGDYSFFLEDSDDDEVQEVGGNVFINLQGFLFYA